ncbi:hypothetical protein M2334_000098 [Sphingobium sp. B11D3D]|nr:hypothetical protein [Sphingobium sp. B11D3D]
MPMPADQSNPAAARPSRTNLLLSATIEAEGIAAPVRIRNLSEHGALLEGAALPPVGAGLVLRRLQLEMGATVIWVDKNRCGVRFEGTISVSGWREGNWIAAASQIGLPRADAPLPSSRPAAAGTAPRASAPTAELDRRIAEELDVLRHLIEDLGTQLVETVDITSRATALQQFDLAAQTLGYLAEVLKAPDRAAAIDAIGMERLRQRLLGGG